MSRKILIYLLVFVLSLFVLTSCDGLFNRPVTEDEFDGSYDQIVIADENIDILSVRSEILSLKGLIGTVLDTEAQIEHEIVFGDTNRAITALAKAQLQKIKSESEERVDYGYIIYFDGKSVAIYWEHNNLMDLAINKFLTKCVKEDELLLNDGVVFSECFTQAYIDSEALWTSIKQKVDDDLYRALRAFVNSFDGRRITEWMANLWDGEIGGFYYSNSARDYVGFAPDIESTAQIITFMEGSGATDDVNALLPNEIKIKLVDFVINMQYPDGYFYHEQWPIGKDKLQADRYGRDLGSATSLLRKFTVDRNNDGVEETVYPKYCTPSGIKCLEHSTKGGLCTYVSVTAFGGSVTSSVDAAVSRIPSSIVTQTALSSAPDFSSKTAFKAWLHKVLDPNIKTNPGTDAHFINAYSSEIKNHGYSAVVVEYLEEVKEAVYREQMAADETPSGFWSYEPSWSLAMSVHKYGTFYDAAGAEFKYYKEATATCIEMMLLDEEEGKGLNDLMNQWMTIGYIYRNVREHHPDEVALLYNMVRERGIDLIDRANSNLEAHRLGDGTFLYLKGKSMFSLYGVKVSLGVREADANGHQLILNLYNAVFASMNLPKVPMCTKEDGANFVSTILGLDDIEKKDVPKRETMDFEDSSKTDMYVGKYITMGANTNKASISVIEDPLGEKGNILSFTSGIGSPSGDFLYLYANDDGGNCNIVEFDFYVAEYSRVGQLYQIIMSKALMLAVITNGEYLSIRIISDGTANPRSEDIITYADKISIEEWHRLRIEAYDVEEGEVLPKFKFFVDDEFIKESSIYFGSENAGSTYNSAFTRLEIYSMASVETVTCVDNIYCSRESKEYSEDHNLSDMRDK